MQLKTYNLCGLLAKINITCPVPSGVRNASWDMQLPDFIQAAALTERNDVLFCVQPREA